MNRREINPDDAIDRLLTGLRDVDPPQGMEGRILIAARESTATRRTSTLAAARAWTVALASVAMVATAIAGVTLRNHRNGNLSADVREHDSPATAVQQTAAAGIGKPQSTPIKRLVQTKATQKDPANAQLSEEEALALSEMNAPSRPAPPLPLTRQEQLLAEAAHQAGPKELSSLRPEIKARQMELSKAEFHDFFEPPPAKDNE